MLRTPVVLRHMRRPQDDHRFHMYKIYRGMLLSLILVTALASPAPAALFRAAYLYTLSDFNGAIPYNWVNLAVDRRGEETYVADPAGRSVRVFNDSGMEVYRFGDNGDFRNITAVAVADSGEIFVLSRSNASYAVTRCDYRGEPKARLAMKGLPPEYATDFVPDTICWHGDHLYLVDRNTMKVALTDREGSFDSGYELGTILGFSKKQISESGMVGFSVDNEGDLLFTVPVFFSAYLVTPGHQVRSFGMRGSTPGKFNIVSGIASDERGNIYVADTLRCVVMIFDRDFSFQAEFGFRGLEPGNLIAPMELVVNHDRVYVAQSRARGVSVYRVFQTQPSATSTKGG